MAEYWPAPAKINLFLRITGQRVDGYHELQTAFQFLDLSDTLAFAVRQDGKIVHSNPVDGVAKNDLCVKAARLLQATSSSPLGVTIDLKKRIPLGAGLGGGSSDAATTMLALNNLWKLQFTKRQLLSLAAQLGADVPVFIYGYAAWAEGIGEKLRPLSVPDSYYCVLVPPVNVSTALIFSDTELTRDGKRITMADFLAGKIGNDLEAVTTRLYPEVLQALTWLSKYGPARMTGSGAGVFVPIANKALGYEILSKQPANFLGFVVKGLNQHPLYDLPPSALRA